MLNSVLSILKCAFYLLSVELSTHAYCNEHCMSLSDSFAFYSGVWSRLLSVGCKQLLTCLYTSFLCFTSFAINGLGKELLL